MTKGIFLNPEGPGVRHHMVPICFNQPKMKSDLGAKMVGHQNGVPSAITKIHTNYTSRWWFSILYRLPLCGEEFDPLWPILLT